MSQLLMFTFGLLSGSVSGFRSAPGLTVLPLKKKKKKVPCWLLSLCMSSRLLEVMGCWAQCSFSLVSAEERGSVWATIITCVQFPAHCSPSTLRPSLSTLRSYMGLTPINHLALHPFDQSVRCAVGSNCTHNFPSLLAGQLHAQGPCPAYLSSLFEKISVGTTATRSHCPAFQHTPTR